MVQSGRCITLLVLSLLLAPQLVTCKQRMYQGVDVSKHVPTSVLPPGRVVQVIDVHYRIVGPECKEALVDQNGLRKALSDVFLRLNSIAGLIVEFPHLADTAPAPGTDGTDGSVTKHAGFTEMEASVMEDFSLYNGVSFIVRTGVERETTFPDIGAQEWTYNRMMETMLKSINPYETRFLITHLNLIPEGVDVLKYIPLRAHYADKTLLELKGTNILPFGRKKQNMLLVALDYLGLSIAAKAAYINITEISTEVAWLEETGDIGIARVTLVTMSDDSDCLFGSVLEPRLDDLEERLHHAGLHQVKASVLSSEPTGGSLHDQIGAALGKGNKVQAYDRRVVRYPPKFRSGGARSGAPDSKWASAMEKLPVSTILVALCVLAGTLAIRLLPRRTPQSQTQQPLIAQQEVQREEPTTPQAPKSATPSERSIRPQNSIDAFFERSMLHQDGHKEKERSVELPAEIERTGSQRLRDGARNRQTIPGTPPQGQELFAPMLSRSTVTRLNTGLPLAPSGSSSASPSPAGSVRSAHPSRSSRLMLQRVSGDSSPTTATPARSLSEQRSQPPASTIESRSSSQSTDVLRLPEESQTPPVGAELDLRGPFMVPASTDRNSLEKRNPFDDSMTANSWGADAHSERFRRDDSAQETGDFGTLSEGQRRDLIKLELERASAVSGWEIDPNDIAICTRADGTDWLLGAGGFGQVYRAIRGGVQDVAIKTLSYSDDLQLQQFLVEIKLLKSLSFDRNVVQFYGACLHMSCPMLVLEYLEGGDLRNALSVEGGNLHLKWYNHGHQIAMDIARGIHFLHVNKVRHGDIKSKNVLLSRDASMAKISDVGMARILTTTLGAQPQQNHMPGTFAYAAPELLLGQPCTEKADIFSLGVLLHELITHEVPVRGQMRDLVPPEECPQEIADLVNSCLDLSSPSRPTARAVFERIRDTMLHAPHTDAHNWVPAHISHHSTSLEADIRRKNQMKAALHHL